MSATRSHWSRWAVTVGLFIAAAACIAAMNWYNIWMSFAQLDIDSSRATSPVTLESQATFQQWVLVTLISLVVSTAAMASTWMGRPNADASDRGFVRGERLEAPNQ